MPPHLAALGSWTQVQEFVYRTCPNYRIRLSIRRAEELLATRLSEPGSITSVVAPVILARGNRAGRRRSSTGFLGDLSFPAPLRSGAAHAHLPLPSSALKTSMLRAARAPEALEITARVAPWGRAPPDLKRLPEALALLQDRRRNHSSIPTPEEHLTWTDHSHMCGEREGIGVGPPDVEVERCSPKERMQTYTWRMSSGSYAWLKLAMFTGEMGTWRQVRMVLCDMCVAI
ncbi:hypothetical protein PR048_018917 [Dryococelus australis]|uniref:Uncharacterized protein n=1 Tax=Dryococelus australis TaxID=614101 RepID=A0ABQ9H205_9NEOP|nr:hypothetical protein PR048_018917 [Dryococelus australis]